MRRRLGGEGGARRRRRASRLRPGRGRAPARAGSLAGGAGAGDARAGRHHRPRRARARARRARDHACRPPRRAPGSLLPRRPGARRARQRCRNGQRLRGCEGAARPHPRRRVCELRCRLRPERPVAGARERRRGAGHALRRLQARERGHRPPLLGGRERAVDRDQALCRLRARPRPGDDLRPDAGDGRRRTGRGLRDRLRRRCPVRLRAGGRPRLRPCCRRAGGRGGRELPGRQRLDGGGRRRDRGRGSRGCRAGSRGTRRRCRSRPSSKRARWRSSIGPLPQPSLVDGVRATIERFR